MNSRSVCASFSVPENATSTPKPQPGSSSSNLLIAWYKSSACCRPVVTTMAFARPPSRPAMMSRKSSTISLAFCCSDVGCSSAKRTSFALAFRSSTSGFASADSACSTAAFRSRHLVS